jgi:hypothetical protein
VSSPAAEQLRGISHALAFLASIAAAVVVVVIAPPGRPTVAAAIYGAGLVATFEHLCVDFGRHRRVFVAHSGTD